eukprot:6261872-Prymnesium_polylepis.1
MRKGTTWTRTRDKVSRRSSDPSRPHGTRRPPAAVRSWVSALRLGTNTATQIRPRAAFGNL